MSLKSISLLIYDGFRQFYLGLFVISAMFVLLYLSPVFKKVVVLIQYQENMGGFGLSSFLTDYALFYLVIVAIYLSSSVSSLLKDHRTSSLYLLLPLSLTEKVLGFFILIYLCPLIFGGIFALFLLLGQHFIFETPFGDVFSWVSIRDLGGAWFIAEYFLLVIYLFLASLVFGRFPVAATALFYFFMAIISFFIHLRLKWISNFQTPQIFFETWFKITLYVIFTFLSLIFSIYLIKNIRYRQWDVSLFSRRRFFSFVSFLFLTFLLIFIRDLSN